MASSPRPVNSKFLFSLLFFSLFVALVAYVVRNLEIGQNKPSSYREAGCVLLAQKDGPFGSEDIVHIGDGLYLVGAGDLGVNVFPKAGTPSPGSMWLVDLESPLSSPLSHQMVKLNVSQLPSHIAFQPHGMFYSHPTQKLYVISHGFLIGGGERVFVIKVKRNEQASDRMKSVTLTFERALQFPEQYGHGVLNDVVEGTYFGEIYLTQWLPRSLPQHGNGKIESLTDIFNAFLLKIAPFASLTQVHRCVFSENAKDGEGMSCVTASSGHSMANGIAVHPNRNVYWVNDLKTVYQFERKSDGTLSVTRAYNAPHYLDNIEWDETKERLLIGSIPQILPALKKLEGDEDVIVPGGILAIDVIGLSMTTAYDVIVHNGQKLNMISAGGIWKDSAILGSPLSTGVLKCPV